MQFHIHDVIQHKAGGSKYRIHAILSDPPRYKTVRIDTGAVFEILMTDANEKYEITEPPPGELAYEVGQVLVNKEGSAFVGVIIEAKAGVQKSFNEYIVRLISPNGEFVRTISYDEKGLIDQFGIRNLRWIILHGDPHEIVRKSIEKKVVQLQEELRREQYILEHLVYFDTETVDRVTQF